MAHTPVIPDIPTAYCFDVDGTLTSLRTASVNPALAGRISGLLKRHIPVGIITGRAVSWLNDRLVPLLLPHIPATAPLYVSAEKGTVPARITDGRLVGEPDSRFIPPDGLVSELKTIAASVAGVFFDPGKQVVLSVEIRGGTPAETTGQIAALRSLVPRARRTVEAMRIPFRVLDEPVIAVDIQHECVDKADAADGFVTFLRGTGFPSGGAVTAFGDSASDIAVAARIAALGHKVTFGYVGDGTMPPQPFAVRVPSKPGMFDAGTLELLEDMEPYLPTVIG